MKILEIIEDWKNYSFVDTEARKLYDSCQVDGDRTAIESLTCDVEIRLAGVDSGFLVANYHSNPITQTELRRIAFALLALSDEM